MAPAAIAARLLLATSARADMPPPPGYVETCTVERQQRPGETCRACGAWFRSREECQRLGAEGYAERCRSYGASVWREVWCRSGPANDARPAEPPPPKPGRARP